MEELFRLIPDEYAEVIKSRLCADKLCEIRISNGAPVRICYDGSYYFLTPSGISREYSKAFVAPRNGAERVVMLACERSLYAVTDTLRRGYVSVNGGIRVGVCGSGVTTNGEVTAVKDFSSVNIRLPHEVAGCAAALASRLSAGLRNTLVISPPGCGKTTVIRDLCRTLSEKKFNVLLCDERFEIGAYANGSPTLDVGCCTDAICGLDKKRVLEMGIANMRPDIIIADELFGCDVASVRRAATCGVAVVATVHARGVDDVRGKPEFADAVKDVFSLFAVLSGPPNYEIKLSEREP